MTTEQRATEQRAPRLPRLAPSDLDEAQRALYDSIVGGPRARGPQLFRLTGDDGALEGPFNAMLHSPAVGADLQRLGVAVRYGTGFTDRTREIAILLVAAAWASDFERYAHEAIGRDVGLTDGELANLAACRVPGTCGDVESLVAEVVLALTQGQDLDDELYARAVDRLGSGGLYELTVLVGYYATLALQLRVFRVPAPPPDPAPGDLTTRGPGRPSRSGRPLLNAFRRGTKGHP